MELIFVHGALVSDGEWWWRPTAELLEKRTGIRSRSVLLPSCGETTTLGVQEAPGGLAQDAASLRRALDDSGPTIVVGHSYGGTVIAEAGPHPSIAHLLYVSSYLPDVGESQASIMSDERNPVSIAPTDDGMLALAGYDESTFGARFLQDAPDAAAAAFARVVPQSVAAFMTPTSQAGWQGVDSSYLVCGQDGSTSVQLQRAHAAKATRSVELPTGHHPFISRPELVVQQLEALLL